MDIFGKVGENLRESMHSAADEMGMEFTSHRLPPKYLREEQSAEETDLSPETKVRFSHPKYLQIMESWQYEEEDEEPEMPPMMAFLPPGEKEEEEVEAKKITNSDSELPDNSEDDSNLPDPYAPEAPGDSEPEPPHFWLFDCHCNNQETHMMVSDVPENPPLQIDEIFRPLVMHLIKTWKEPPSTLQQLSDEFDIEMDCVKELFQHLIAKRIASLAS